jgi:hypothetical protein
MQFVDGPGAEKKIQALLTRAKRVRIAVAYWGAGAVERLGVEGVGTEDVEVVCDVRSGGSNPTEVERLRDILGEKRVMTCDRLHAKVWITDLGAVIGSSNASANGLGHESDETIGLIEANIFVDDASALAVLERWFEQTVKPESRAVTAADLERARQLRKARRRDRPVPDARSVFEALQVDPLSLVGRDFLVWVYPHEDVSNWASDQLEAAQKDREDTRISCWENVTAPPGAYILDFHRQKNGKARLHGLWRVLSDDPVRGTKRRHILLCRPANDFNGMPIGDKAAWEAVASRAGASGREEMGYRRFRGICLC